ncbi:borealin isoform X2 [Gadus morhua]|uniref:borealin isoform X2 n=1 Tax=Gadus morhua TaxID=8049 RepID=UPI0011B56CE1|nr:borealin-like isoform X2 [Gadus morhua]
MAPQRKKTKPAITNQRRAQIHAFLEDFDAEVKTRVLLMKEQQMQLLTEIDNRYNMAIIKLPKAVRQMNWLLYFKKPQSPTVDVSKRGEVPELENVLVENHMAAPKTLQKSSKKAKFSSEDENTAPQTTTKKGKSKRPPVTSKKTRVQSILGMAASTRKNMLEYSTMTGSTPLITPRFDPRPPETPGVRVPRQKERVYSISVNGSPIQSSTKDIIINVPIGNGESIQLLASQMNSVDLSSLDATALQGMRDLQGEDQNGSRYNWIDLQPPIGAKRRVTQQRQLSWLFMKLPEPCCHRALLCLGIKPDPY